MKKRIFLGCLLLILLFCSPTFSQDITIGQFLSAGTIVYYNPPGKVSYNQNTREMSSEYQNMIVLGRDTPILKVIQSNDSGVSQVLLALGSSSMPVNVWVLRTYIEKKK